MHICTFVFVCIIIVLCTLFVIFLKLKIDQKEVGLRSLVIARAFTHSAGDRTPVIL